MTPTDAAKVLTLIAAYDNRQFDETTCRVWADALDGLQLDDCLNGIRQHFRRSKDWLMPSDVRQLARDIIRSRQAAEHHARYEAITANRALDPAEQAAIEARRKQAETPLRERPEIHALIQSLYTTPTIDGENPHPAHDADEDTWARYHADCPWCKAAIRQPCVNTATGQRASVTHPARIEAARGLGLVAK